MLYGLIHSKKALKSLFVIIVSSLLFSLGGCGVTFPEDRNTQWLSTDPYLFCSSCVLYGKTQRTWYGNGSNMLLSENDNIPVSILFSAASFEIHEEPVQRNWQKSLLFSGEWEYDNSGNMVLHVETDNLTGGKYKTITMKPVGTDMEAADAFEGVYPYDKNSQWSSTDPNINIVQKYSYARDKWQPGGDTIQWDNKTHDVITVMTGDRFDIVGNYTHDRGYTEVLLSGSWEYDAAGNLILNVEKDNLMGGMYQTVTLKPIGEPIDEGEK